MQLDALVLCTLNTSRLIMDRTNGLNTLHCTYKLHYGGVMILGQISYLDCLAFVVFLIPQLLINVHFLILIRCLLQALPFLGEQLSFLYLC